MDVRVSAIRNAFCTDTLPAIVFELITRGFQSEITPQLVDGERIAGQGVRGTAFEVLVQRRALVRVAVLGDDGVVHGLEGDHVDQVVGDFAGLVVRADCGGIGGGEDGDEVGGLAGEGFVGFLGPFLGAVVSMEVFGFFLWTFFEKGEQIRKQHQKETPFQNVFSSPTTSDLSHACDRGEKGVEEVRKEEERTPYRSLHLPNLPPVQQPRHEPHLPLPPLLQQPLQFGPQIPLPPQPLAIPDRELFLLTLQYKSREDLEIPRPNLRIRLRIPNLLVSGQRARERLMGVMQRELGLGEEIVSFVVLGRTGGRDLETLKAVVDGAVPLLQLQTGVGAVGEDQGEPFRKARLPLSLSCSAAELLFFKGKGRSEGRRDHVRENACNGDLSWKRPMDSLILQDMIKTAYKIATPKSFSPYIRAELLQSLHLILTSTLLEHCMSIPSAFLAIHRILLEHAVEHIRTVDLTGKVAIVSGIVTTDQVSESRLAISPVVTVAKRFRSIQFADLVAQGVVGCLVDGHVEDAEVKLAQIEKRIVHMSCADD
ncbi:hypothetical protein KC338_g223 [Hortaea werneckii]|nr:hypothetical protein KC338_g223 [Hortaea werneckii]